MIRQPVTECWSAVRKDLNKCVSRFPSPSFSEKNAKHKSPCLNVCLCVKCRNRLLQDPFPSDDQRQERDSPRDTLPEPLLLPGLSHQRTPAQREDAIRNLQDQHESREPAPVMSFESCQPLALQSFDCGASQTTARTIHIEQSPGHAGVRKWPVSLAVRRVDDIW